MLFPPIDTTLLRRYDHEGGKHVHDHAQVLFGVDGVLQVEVEGRGAWVDATCGLVVPAGATHTYCATRTAFVLVLDELTGSATERMRRFALPQGWRKAGFEIDSLANTLLAASSLKVRRRIDLDELAKHIDSDLSRPWTAPELAAACCLSPQRLGARFMQALGLSPLAFVRERRLNRAEQLLHRGFSLDAVACQVGYGSASALSNALRRERHSGAREIRKRRALLAT